MEGSRHRLDTFGIEIVLFEAGRFPLAALEHLDRKIGLEFLYRLCIVGTFGHGEVDDFARSGELALLEVVERFLVRVRPRLLDLEQL